MPIERPAGAFLVGGGGGDGGCGPELFVDYDLPGVANKVVANKILTVATRNITVQQAHELIKRFGWKDRSF